MRARFIAILFVVLGLAQTAHARVFGDEAYEVVMSYFAYDKGFPLNPRTVGEQKAGEQVYQRFVFDSFHGGVVTGLLALPERSAAPAPVVLLLHGLGDSKKSWTEDGFTHGALVAQGLLAKGFAVLALDAQFHGDRAVFNDYVDPGEMVFQRGWGVRYANLFTQTVVDYRRALDHLENVPGVDPARVAVVGYSMGGHMTFPLAASDARVKTVVSCVVPETPRLFLEASTFVRGLSDKRVLMMMARRDQFYTVASAQALLDSIPGQQKEIRFFASGHALPPEYAGQVVDWLSENL